ncbi:dimethylmenaquinone methyltransferase, partial [Methylobacterium trifolii]
MTVTQITHHDLDGYGAATIVGAHVDVARIVHVPRYSDVGPVVEDELKRLNKAKASETLIMTDLGLESVAVKFIKSFAAMNRRREEAGALSADVDTGSARESASKQRHRLIVLDHHASSIGQLQEQGLEPTAVEGGANLMRFDLQDPDIVVLIDDGVCATRMAYVHRALYATREADGLEALVEAVDALDLWKKERPAFRGGLTLDEIFWDNVSNLVPIGHPWHDRFVGELLKAVSALLSAGASPAEIETQVGATRKAIVDGFLAGEPDDDRSLTTRMRIARVLARSTELFRPLSDGTLLSFGLDSGTFQRVSDLIMEGGGATRVMNVQRMGSVSLRSNNETALDGARKFRGGGHRDAAGGKLPSGSAFSLADALAQVQPGNPNAANESLARQGE